MLFNSYVFIFGFLPITLIIFFGLSKIRLTKLAIAWLATSSLIFYGYWSMAYVPLLGLSILFNYLMGRLISHTKQGSKAATILLIFSIGINLSVLAYYKYAVFFITSLGATLHFGWTVPQIILPLGISFYTFTQTAYLVDAYRGETKDYDLLTYVLFVTFFPHLIAGPILHHSDIIPQFHNLKNFIFSHKNTVLGLSIFTLGLAKKVLIADTLSPWVAAVFNHANSVNFLEAWFGALSYTLQLYFDFSGYSDMAIGLGLMLNIYLPINFNSPYKATSVADFWRRWHITLSNFLRDYLYIPLGGNRKGEFQRYRNLLITMLLGGLWHGAGWTFIIWGGLHGIYLAINHWWRTLNIQLPKPLAWSTTFVAVLLGWVLFRAQSFNDAAQLLQTMLGIKSFTPGTELSNYGFKQFVNLQNSVYIPEFFGYKILSLFTLATLLLGVVFLPNTQQILQNLKPRWWTAIGIGLLAGSSLLFLNRVSEFLYFQF